MSVEDRILALMERINRVYTYLLREKAYSLRISPLHANILLYIYHNLDYPDKHKITKISKELMVRQPTVSEAIQSLEKKGLIEKQTGESDKRIRRIKLTEKGLKVVNELIEFAEPLKDSIIKNDFKQSNLLDLLMDIAKDLYDKGIINELNMCKTCRFFKIENKTYSCKLLNIKLTPLDLRVDCPEYIAIT